VDNALQNALKMQSSLLPRRREVESLCIYVTDSDGGNTWHYLA